MGAPETEEKRDLLDLLYEGGDESALSAEEQGELATWRELRVALRELPDAEPRDDLSILMAAAREHAAANTPHGLWARVRGWFAVMAAHPAMSAAATVVVVAGVAGAFYVSGRVGSEGAQRASSSTTVATGPLSPTSPEPPTPPASRAPGSAAAGSGSSSSSAAGSGSAVAQEAAELDWKHAAANTASAQRGELEKRVPAHEHHVIVAHTEPAVRDPRPPVVPEKPMDGDVAAGEGVSGVDDGIVGNQNQNPADTGKSAGAPGGYAAPTTTPAPPPPPPPPAQVAAEPTDESEVAVVAKDEPKAAQHAPAAPQPDPKALTRQAIAAAKKKDCKTVDALAARVIQLDEGYYRSTFATDPDVRDNCPGATRK